MNTIDDIIGIMDDWAPPSLAESWDNVGLLTGSPDREVKSIVLTLDVTDHTIEIARSLPLSLIISHHPLIFKPLSRLSGNDRTSKLVRSAVKYDVAIFAAHTNLDRAPDGVSHALARHLGLSDITPLTRQGVSLCKFVTFVPPEHTDTVRHAAGDAGAGVIGEYRYCSFTSGGTGTFVPSDAARPFSGKAGDLSRERENRLEMVVPESLLGNVVEAARKVHPYEEMAYDIIPLWNDGPATGYGAVGMLPEPLSRDRFLKTVSASFGNERIDFSMGGPSDIRRVAVMGGSGSSEIPNAIREHADAYVTSEIGHHSFLDYGDEMLLVSASHRATELPILAEIQKRLSAQCQNITFQIETGTLPFIQSHPE